ncbi:MAG: SocA family protein [Bacteroidales bacterium]|nr:SocA family protein [Bacteroidales bacterium]
MSGTQKCDVYRIVKAAFIAQKFHIVRYLRPLYMDKIVALPYGPVPSALYDVLKYARGDSRFMDSDSELKAAAVGINFEDEVFSAIEKPDMDYLSVSQVECLDDAIEKVANMSFNEIRDTTHQAEWQRASQTPQREMDLLAIAKEEGADDASIEYLKESLSVDKMLA